MSRFVGSIDNYCIFDSSKDLIENYMEIKQDVATRWGIHYQILVDPLLFSLNQMKILLHRIHYAFRHGYNISNQIEMEILLYLSLQRQIDVGLQFAGVSAKNLLKTDSIQFLQLFFGERESLLQLFKHLSTKWNAKFIHSWNPPQKDEILSLIAKYRFSPHHIHNKIIGFQKRNQEPLSGEIDEFRDVEEEMDIGSNQSLNIFSREQLNDAAVDLFNVSTVKLFLENVRPTKLYQSEI